MGNDNGLFNLNDDLPQNSADTGETKAHVPSSAISAEDILGGRISGEKQDAAPKTDLADINEFIRKPEAGSGSGVSVASFMEEYADEPQKPKRRHLFLKLSAVIIILAVIAGVVYIKYTGEEKRADEMYSSLAEKVTDEDGVDKNGILKKFLPLYEINENFAGFITLPDAEYGYPVAAVGKDDTEQAQSELFDGSDNKYGTVYTSSDFTNSPALYVLHSNNFGDGRMLGGIEDFAKGRQNGLIKFATSGDEAEYVVFSSFGYEDDEPFLIERTEFLNDTTRGQYIEKFYDNSEVDFDVNVTPSDDILILVAEGEKSFVAAARKLYADESPDKITKRVKETAAETEKTGSKPKKTDKIETPDKKAEVTSTASDTYYNQKPKTQKQKNSGRIEQTGLTADMDKTVKVEVANIVTVPSVIGMTKASAQSVLTNTIGLVCNVEVVDSQEPKNTVVDQTPAENAEVSTDVTATIYISRGLTEGSTIVPDFVGNALSNAEIILMKSNLEKGKVTKVKSSLEKGTILSQSVEPDTKVSVNTKIKFSVSDGSVAFKTVKMPNLSGKTKSAAKNAIKKAGLKVGKISTVTNSKKAGTVVSQDVKVGAKVEEGGTVGFSVSNGSKINNLTVTNESGWSVTVDGKTYGPGAVIKGDYNDIIPCVIEAEMGSGCHIEGLKAQAVATYSWLINAGSTKGSAPGVPMKTAGSRAKAAAAAVTGQKAKYGGEVAQTYYYAISAGYTANCKDIWWADIPYLRAVESPVCKNADGYKTTVSYSASEMKQMIKNTYGIDVSGTAKSKWFSIKYDENGCYARKVTIGGKKSVGGSSIRDELCGYELRSTAFKIKYKSSTDTFVFTVYGYGHGVGMSQVGADAYARQGWDYKQILTHYFPGITIS